MTRPQDPARVLALACIEGAFRRGWQGPTLSGSLRGVTAREALFSPGRGRKCIWQHTLHAAYWKHAVVRALTGIDPPPFERSPSNWPAPPQRPDDGVWRADRVYLARMHALLVEAVAGVKPRDLSRTVPGRRHTYAFFIAGAAAHDAYHTGQIQLLKRLGRS